MNPCATCKHLFIVNAKDQWYRWLCMAVPLPPWYNQVTGQTTADPPYELCKRRREGAGECKDWCEGLNQLSPDKLKVFVHTMEGVPLSEIKGEKNGN